MDIINYDTIKSMAKEQGLTINDLCALATNNDPFFVGRDSQKLAAEWFTTLWQRFGYGRGVHLRRVHYQIVSQDPPLTRPDGQTYENTENNWDYLNNASKWARYLGLVSPAAFVDRRNPEAIIYARWAKPEDWDYQDPEPGYEITDEWDAVGYELPELPRLPQLPYSLPSLPHFSLNGYRGIEQAYHLEIWCEKTTMNDVLDPLCRRYNVNLITGAGEMSITAVVEFLQRVRTADRPARILYISDFDPAGLGMPISVARKIEYFIYNEGWGDMDIKLQPIVLTAAQVATHRLPRVPVKDSDRRKGHFEAAHGEGQVELDALEALYPGVLAGIVNRAILQYVDPTLESRAEEARAELGEMLEDERNDVMASYQAELADLSMEYTALLAVFEQTREEFSELVADFQPKIDAHKELLDAILSRGEALYSLLSSDLAQIDIDPPALPLPNLPAENRGQLFDSRRDYFSQLAAYKAQRNGNN